jgi:hypothetical protein
MDYEAFFIHFPFRNLNIKVYRRDLINSLMKEVVGFTRTFNNKPTFSIADLGELPLEDLINLTPAIYDSCEFKLSDGMVFGKPPRHLEFVQLFPVNSSAHVMFQFFNKSYTLKEMGMSVRKRFPLDEKESLYFVRGLFLFLAEEGFAYPKFGRPNHD